jgi:ribosomal protein S18 acetylase RimI-like enzyme
MTALPQFEILDLRHFNGRQLRPILEQEGLVWRDRLRWDYASSTELLLQYLDLQILPGYVALMRGQICGYCFCVYEGNKSVIGDIFVLPSTPSRQSVTEILTRHLIEMLAASPDIDRIEAQLLLFDTGVLSQTFTSTGFIIFPRLFLECELECELERGPTLSALPPPRPVPASVELCRWIPGFYQPTAELIHAAYEGHLDSQINDQYRTLHGSLRFLHNIVRFPGCGVFDPEGSWVLRDRASHALVGVILCSQVSPAVAHVTQICVASSMRGHGLGQSLLRHCMQELRARGCKALTLTVSEQNHSSLRLYTAAGFTTRLRFEALVLEKSLRRRDGKLTESFRAPSASSVRLNAGSSSGSAGFFSFARRKPAPVRS